MIGIVITGNYVLICASMVHGQAGKFVLDVRSTSSFKLQTIPQEGAGMFRFEHVGNWYAIASCIWLCDRFTFFLSKQFCRWPKILLDLAQAGFLAPVRTASHPLLQVQQY